MEDELGYPRGRLNLDLQNVRLRRKEHPQLQLFRRDLVGDSMCGFDEHFICHSLRVGCVYGHADSGEDIQVVGLGWQVRLPVKVNRWELHTASVDRLALRPNVCVLGQTFVFLTRVGKRKDDWPLVVERHSLDDFLREQFADGADADEDRRLEVLNGRDDLWLLGRQIEMIKGFAGRSLVGIGKFGCAEAGTPCNY